MRNLTIIASLAVIFILLSGSVLFGNEEEGVYSILADKPAKIKGCLQKIAENVEEKRVRSLIKEVGEFNFYKRYFKDEFGEESPVEIDTALVSVCGRYKVNFFGLRSTNGAAADLERYIELKTGVGVSIFPWLLSVAGIFAVIALIIGFIFVIAGVDEKSPGAVILGIIIIIVAVLCLLL